MRETPGIVQRAAEFAISQLTDQLPSWAAYHSVEHTEDTARWVEEIGTVTGLGAEDLEIVFVSAWLHDLGYLEGPEDHEERGAALAARFLRKEGYPDEKIAIVVGCILATAVPHRPRTVLEMVLCDADTAHVGSTDFFERSNLLRAEMETRLGSTFSEREWVLYNIRFVAQHRFHTPYARRRFAPQHAQNLALLEQRLRELPPFSSDEPPATQNPSSSAQA